MHDQVAYSASSSQHSPELFPALAVAQQFLSDFEKSGIHLPRAQRNRFVDLSDEILSLGRSFTTPIELDLDDKSRMVPATLAELDMWNGGVAHLLGAAGMGMPRSAVAHIHADSPEGNALRREHPQESVRRRFYETAFKSSQERLDVLHEMLKKRGELAQLVGQRSWADVAMLDKMAKTPGEPVRGSGQ